MVYMWYQGLNLKHPTGFKTSELDEALKQEKGREEIRGVKGGEETLHTYFPIKVSLGYQNCTT